MRASCGEGLTRLREREAACSGQSRTGWAPRVSAVCPSALRPHDPSRGLRGEALGGS